jgi:hypothetical protein
VALTQHTAEAPPQAALTQHTAEAPPQAALTQRTTEVPPQAAPTRCATLTPGYGGRWQPLWCVDPGLSLEVSRVMGAHMWALTH